LVSPQIANKLSLSVFPKLASWRSDILARSCDVVSPLRASHRSGMVLVHRRGGLQIPPHGEVLCRNSENKSYEADSDRRKISRGPCIWSRVVLPQNGDGGPVAVLLCVDRIFFRVRTVSMGCFALC